MAAAPIAPRIDHAMVWAGTRVFVWGGFDATGRPLADGATFDPASGTWRRLPAGHATNTAARPVWTGRDVVVVSATRTDRYDLQDRTWRRAPAVPTPRGYVLTDQVRAAGTAVVAVTASITSRRPPAIFALAPDATRWRRLADPPVAFVDGDLVLSAADRLLLFTRSSPAAAAALELDLGATRARWTRHAPPPGLGDHRLARLIGALAGDRIVLWGTGPPHGATYAAVGHQGRWRRVDPGPVQAGRLIAAVGTGNGVVVWDEVSHSGAVLDLTVGRWARLSPPPIDRSAPRPVVWTGSGVLTWGGLGIRGALYTPR